MYSADCGNGAGDQLQDAFSNGRINEEHVYLGAGSSCFGIFICAYFDFSTYGKAECRDKQTVCNDIYGSCKNFSWLLLMVVSTLCILALGIFVFWPLLLFGAGSIAYIHSLILVYIVFPKDNWNY